MVKNAKFLDHVQFGFFNDGIAKTVTCTGGLCSNSIGYRNRIAVRRVCPVIVGSRFSCLSQGMWVEWNTSVVTPPPRWQWCCLTSEEVCLSDCLSRTSGITQQQRSQTEIGIQLASSHETRPPFSWSKGERSTSRARRGISYCPYPYSLLKL